MKYLTEAQIIYINHQVIERADEGSSGVLDAAGVNAVIAQPQYVFFGREAYPSIWLKAAYILHKITKKYIFIDGNKRTAYLSTVAFLRLNGYQLNLSTNNVKNLMIQVTLAKDTEDEMIKVAGVLKQFSISIEA